MPCMPVPCVTGSAWAGTLQAAATLQAPFGGVLTGVNSAIRWRLGLCPEGCLQTRTT